MTLHQMSLLAEPLVSLSASPDSAKGLPIHAGTSPSSTLQWLTAIGPSGWFGKTSPAYCHRTEDGTLVPSSGRWSNSGMGTPTESLTLNTSEWPSDAAVCSLSQILETGDVPQRVFLSPKACQGILRRAEKRGKTLPPPLAHALQAVVDSEQISTLTAD